MNKIFLTLAAAAAFVLTACTADTMTGDSGGETTTVTLTAQLPTDAETRAYSDGTTATYLSYAVYHKASEYESCELVITE